MAADLDLNRSRDTGHINAVGPVSGGGDIAIAIHADIAGDVAHAVDVDSMRVGAGR